MKKNILTVTFLVAFSLSGIACTNFLVGKKASADGSTMISYSADSYWLYGALYHYPRASYGKEAMLKVYDWDSGNYLGEIRQAAQTCNVVGNMNEYQVSIGETTFGGRHELVDTTGIIDYGSLIYIALQRSKSAREAIKIMTSLVDEYGYCSEGESFSIADPNEVWIMEMVGKGAGSKGAVWAAIRIPEDCVSAHANQARITKIPFGDKQNCMYSRDVVDFARKKGYFYGKDSDFSFSDSYNPLDYEGLRFCEARVWAFFNALNPKIGDKFYSYINADTRERMPLYIKPDSLVTINKMKNLMRNHYEDTPLDMTTGAGSGPFGTPFRYSPLTYKVDRVAYFHERPIATQQTGFTFVAQMRNWLPNEIGGILWFGVDDASTGIYVPMYCCLNIVPPCFNGKTANLFEFSWNSAFWVNNWVASMVYNRWSVLYPELQKQQNDWDIKFEFDVKGKDNEALAMIKRGDSAKDIVQMLTQFSYEQAQFATSAWKQLGEKFMIKYLDGVMKGVDDEGIFLQNSKHIPQKIIRDGYPENYSRKEFVQPDKNRFRVKTQKEMEDRW
ncbi:MAG: C69 family dipeptidase [Prevotellaceae bacterium]|jgi:dipeptidase|nr:C69 family dipeptidase [Prevotellaceae bacterium]